jgi:hypothetical protein
MEGVGRGGGGKVVKCHEKVRAEQQPENGKQGAKAEHTKKKMQTIKFLLFDFNPRHPLTPTHPSVRYRPAEK